MGKALSSESPSTSFLNAEGRFSAETENDEVRTPSAPSLNLSPPRVPVIFVLGGPGSGKITHCDRAVQERHGLAHVNMTDLIQQHIVGNSLSEFGHIPAKSLIQILIMEMKMAVTASGYLISGYPRSMRDVVEYNEKLQRVDHVILLNWHVKILEKQIEFGAQLGDTVLQLARMELRNYSKNVLGVAEYYDQMKILSVVDGERQPTEVYTDFLSHIDQILEKSHVGGKKMISTPSIPHPLGKIIFVIGGPGSNKGTLAGSTGTPRWKHVSIGRELRNRSDPKELDRLRVGELASNDAVLAILKDRLSEGGNFIIDGFPRNLPQLRAFEHETGQLPPCVLVDCSEVELGRSLGERRGERGREDDNSLAVKRRLENYRSTTLPTLKALDDDQRLFIIDGDSEKEEIKREFLKTVSELITAGDHDEPRPIPRRKPSTDTIHKMYLEVDEMNK